MASAPSAEGPTGQAAGSSSTARHASGSPPAPTEPWGLDGPYFDDLVVGHRFAPAPAVTLDAGIAAQYQAICGDPLALASSVPLAEAVTGEPGPVANPTLVLQLAIGQSTVATRRVIANLFYRGVLLRRTVRHGETLATEVTVRGRRAVTPRPDRPARGMVLLGIRTTIASGEVVVDFERCALLPCRDLAATPEATDDLGTAGGELDLGWFEAGVPRDWDLGPLGLPAGWAVGETRHDPLADVVAAATELVRLTGNLAAVHRDHRLGHGGRRLVYGGHTIGLAQASLGRLLPSQATVVGWHACDHLAPVLEGDLLATSATLRDVRPVTGGRLLAFDLDVVAHRDGHDDPVPVLAFTPVVLAP